MPSRNLIVVALVSLLAGCAGTKSLMHGTNEGSSQRAFEQTPIAPTHPLVGVWRVDMERTVLKPTPGFDAKCVEEYEVKVDGSKTSRSGEERNESKFAITPVGKDTYWYKWVDQITSTNGKLDCTGSRTTVGHTSVNYALVHPSGDRFALCESQDMNTCYVELFLQKR